MRNVYLLTAVTILTSTAAYAQAVQEWPANPAMATHTENNSVIGSEGGGAIPSLPLQVMTAGGISYITGGIGDEEEAQLKSAAHDYNVHMMMTAPGGEYISDVTLRISDDKGTELLSIGGVGPYFYARVNPGTYNVDLTAPGGTAKRLTVKVPQNGSADQHIVFAEDGGITTTHIPKAKIK